MADPVLLLHRADPELHVYTTGSVQSPASIRDQMIRGRLLIQRAELAGLISDSKSLVVVGAGAGGATAAMTAKELGVPCTLVDSEPLVGGQLRPFARQRGCTTRQIEPSLYDWPLPRHNHSSWGHPSMPLTYTAGLANDVVMRDLDPAFKAAKLRTSWGAIVEDKPERGLSGMLEVKVKDVLSGDTSTLLCDMVLFAIGAGQETVTVGAYSGYRFWDSDAFNQVPLVNSGNGNVLISGGGDGALQDLIRIVTDPERAPSPYMLWDAIRGFVDHEVLLRIAEIEDQAQRMLLWSGSKPTDCDVHIDLRIGYAAVLRELWKSGNMVHIREALAGFWRDPLPKVTLLHPCSHFSRCYGLNHFISLLIFELLRHRGVTRKPGYSLSTVRASVISGHSCRSAASCHGADHDVELIDETCRGGKGSGAPLNGGTHNVVVVRHGIDGKAMKSPVGPVPLARQMLPYDLL